MPVIVMEKLQFSLRGLVTKHSEIDISFNNTIIILKDVCLGLQYLHTRTPPIVHRDLTPNNILLCYHLRAKITDLGVARTLQATDKTLTKAPGTRDFMPPECLADKPVYGLPLDIFSFGGVILYITTRQWPSPSSWISINPETNEKLNLSESERRQQYLDDMTGRYAKFKPLVLSCLEDIPTKRPIVAEVLIEIQKIQKAYSRWAYPEVWADVDKLKATQPQKQEEQQQGKQQQKQGSEKQKQEVVQQPEEQPGIQELQQVKQNHQHQPKVTKKEVPRRKKTGLKSLLPGRRRTRDSLTMSGEVSSDSELSDISSSLSQEEASFDEENSSLASATVSKPEPTYPLFIAKYDCSAEADEDLSFQKGDKLYIINADRGEWWYAKAMNSGQAGYIPHNYVTKLRPPKPVPKVSNRPLYVAKYDFATGGDKCLSFKKGDKFYMLNIVEGDWWFARAKHSGQEGYIPKSYIAKVNTLEAEDWYFGAITRKHAENLLMQPFNDNGSFLIRNSESTPGDYSLSLKFANRAGHYRIKHTSKGYCISNWAATFASIPELIAHYSKQSDGLRINLKTTCLITKPQTTDTCEEATETWEVDRRSIQFIKKHGAGKFGEVWQGIWNDTTDVAVKILKIGIISASEFTQEVALIKQIRHPKLIQVYAVCTQEEPIYIITEFMKHGSLLEYLRGDGRSLKLPQLLNVGAQVAAGMAYLEAKNYVHRDLAARNVLVSEDLTCKVKSFSTVRILSESIYEAHTGSKFPIKWTAPEAISYNCFTVKSDVWSFGILLYELITYGRFPYPGMNDAEVIEKLKAGYRMPCPERCPEQLHKIMRECWRDDAESRPTFESLCWRMEDFFVENEPTHFHLHELQ